MPYIKSSALFFYCLILFTNWLHHLLYFFIITIYTLFTLTHRISIYNTIILVLKYIVPYDIFNLPFYECHYHRIMFWILLLHLSPFSQNSVISSYHPKNENLYTALQYTLLLFSQNTDKQLLTTNVNFHHY